MAEQHSTDISNNAGGVMTDEVGVITGDLTLSSELDELATVRLRVRYTGADEWYTVTNGRCQLTGAGNFLAVHQLAVALLHRPEG